MRRRWNTGLPAAAAGAIATGAMLFPAVSSSTASKPQLSEHRILRIALKAAAESGDRKPSLIQHAEGTRYRANLVAGGDIVPGNSWCYLIAERGRFVAKNYMGPSGSHPPRGTVITLVVDARSGVGFDFGISNRYPDLRRLGAVHTDLG